MQRSALCRSRRELSNAYLLAKIGVDTAENEPLEVWGKIQFTIHFTPYSPTSPQIPSSYLNPIRQSLRHELRNKHRIKLRNINFQRESRTGFDLIWTSPWRHMHVPPICSAQILYLCSESGFINYPENNSKYCQRQMIWRKSQKIGQAVGSGSLWVEQS